MMLRRDASMIAKTAGGRLLTGMNQCFEAVSIDTRTLCVNSAFFCIKGPNFDAHDFIEEAIEKGASVIVVEHESAGKLPATLGDEIAVVAVDNSAAALQASARAWADDNPAKIIGLTGSSGKTTTKDMLSAMLRTAGPTLATEGNLNNHFGVPLTLWKIRPDHRFAVVEMGMNAPGEIEFLCGLAQPTFGLVTSVGEAHIEGVGSIEGVARAKGELLRSLSADCMAFYPSDIAHKDILCEGVLASQFTVGEHQNDLVRISKTTETDKGVDAQVVIDSVEYTVRMPMRGRHNLDNACLALAVVSHLELDISMALAALSQLAPPAMRGELRYLQNGSEITLDCYNANPQSMRAAISTFSVRHPRGILALGDMLELGLSAPQAHSELGHYVFEHTPEAVLVGIGELSRHLVDGARTAGAPPEQLHWFDSAAAAGDFIVGQCDREQAVLLKGSRGMRLEQIWDRLSQSERA
ncbi:MAG: UDP-N-acetylmuramoyl-tripeptide--D-alanyl-D-alanine ligase [Myxococcota bacterium]|nr:UDP-N-acetylmuramoyl-tripeptide--D-alanyl-D-alanine ligase [Myxococcota bacterium]